MSERKLPTHNGAVIRTCFTFDKVAHYGSAILGYDDEDGIELVWYRSGFSEPFTQERMAAAVSNGWEELAPTKGAR